MSEYTPTTETVIECFLDGATGEFIEEDVRAWLGEVERAAAEKAWDEGRIHGYDEGREYHAFGNGCGPDTWDCDCKNPYRR